ncbi:MAG: hypothetical protein HYY59_03770 [Candidatus Omnitrophica bacterium]|nr:hypothetical protein [Candidatus Omnitrophota bacterium]
MYTLGEKIIPREIEEEIKDSYISYAMSVIVGRALPDVRDGLKPVHRRILYGMQDLGLDPGKPYKKAARIVGEILGKYHPHGDIAVFDALVRMVQDFSLRYPLIDGQGNFGCFTGDTKIKLLDGTNKSFEELSQLPPTTTFYVYSVNKDNQIVVGQSRHARATRRNAALVEVVLDNEAKIRCTPDHRFLLRNGTYKEARDLTPDDSLMAGYHDLAPVREELFAVAGKQNHRAASVRLVQERADVYDITVDEHHNFLLDAGVFVHNSVDGDAPAAMRYVEARLAPVATELLSDIDKDTVDFVPNFDGSLTEPKVLPSRLPNLLVNGSSGIAVGMATNIPPHNLSEVVDAACALIDNPEIELSGLTRHIRGPDFPTGAIICGRDGIKDAYQAGRGSLRIRAKAQSEQLKGNRQALVITELPYQVNKATLLETIAKLVQEKTIEGISDLRDESDKDGMRVVIELKRDANDQVVLNQLYKHTQLETTFGIIMLALVDGRPRVLGLKALLQTFRAHPRGAQEGARPSRRRHQDDSAIEEPPRSEGGARQAVRLHRETGAGHPRDAAPAPHRPGAR